MKFLPAYRLNVEVRDGNVPIALPYSCEFEISRASASSSQTATFRLYNLNKETRNQIQKDWFTFADIRALQFSAGYPGEMQPMLFNGTVKQAQSYRQGEDDITEIEGWDGASAMTNGYSLMSEAAGQSVAALLKKLAANLPGLTAESIIGLFPNLTKRGTVFAGNTWNYILQLSQGQAFIDNNQLKVLNQDEVLKSEFLVLTSASGLLDTPRRFNAMIKVPILFEPRLTVGQIVQLKSDINSVYNGAYKVMGFTHRGIISPTVDGERTTVVTLWDGLNNARNFTYPDGSAVSL